jgi:hypothetical protein
LPCKGIFLPASNCREMFSLQQRPAHNQPSPVWAAVLKGPPCAAAVPPQHHGNAQQLRSSGAAGVKVLQDSQRVPERCNVAQRCARLLCQIVVIVIVL